MSINYKCNLSWWRIVKMLCCFVCIGYMIGQSFTLLRQYLSNETQISVDYSYQDNVVPGITVCYPRAISLFNLIKNLNQQSDIFFIREAFGKDQAFFNTLTEDDIDTFNEYFKNKSEHGDKETLEFVKVLETRLNETLVEVSKLFGERVEFTFADYLYWTVISSLEVFSPKSPSEIFHSSIPFSKVKYGDMRDFNMMIKKHHLIDQQPKDEGYPVDVSVYGLVEQGGQLGNQVVKLKDEQPIESIIFNDDTDWKKCFTYFSHLNTRWRSLRMLVNKINIDVFHKPLWFPSLFFKYEGFSLSMHSPDEFSTKRLGIEAFKDVNIDYQVMVHNQTHSKDIVNCKDYDLSSGQYYERTRTTCVKKCLQDRQDECTQCSALWGKCFFEGHNLWTRSQMPDQQVSVVSLESKSDIVQSHVSRCNASRFHFDTVCRQICRHKCVDREYNYQIKSSDKAFASRVEIMHQHPDQLSEVMPKMSWVDFLSQLGGLIGLWLGLSFYAIAKIFINSIRYLTYKFYQDQDSQANGGDEKYETELMAVKDTK